MSQTPSILTIPIADLITDPVIELSGRTKAERVKNAQELVPKLKGGWDEGQPGQVFQRDGKWHVAAGFTRVYAFKELLKDKDAIGYFVEVPDEPAKLRTAAIRTNSGKDISSLAKGNIFVKMRDGDDPTKMTVGQVALAGMSLKEIAEEVGCSPQLVTYCIAIAESPEPIRELLEQELVNGNVVDRARQLATDKKTKEVDEAKWLKAIKASIKNAQANGKDSASMPDLQAIKDEVFPPTALKASGGSDAKKPATDTNPGKEEKEEEEESEEKDKSPKGGDGSQSAMNLGSDAPTQNGKKDSDFNKRHRQDKIDVVTTLIRKADDEFTGEKTRDDDGVGIGLSDDEIEHIAAFLVDSNINVPLSPI